MNFKRFGRTANLFDEANLEGGIYLASNGNKYGSITDGVRSGVKINVLPNTQYTLSLYSNMNISIRILQWSGETYITHTPKYNVSGNVSLTITTNSTTDKIAFNVEGVNGQYAENLMLNEGSTALPYQPYMDWTNIPHYLHNTSTDTLATLPAVLYPNGTTATVGLKGNMSQTGTPTPTTPIQPQECGERTGNLVEVLNSNCIIYSAYNHFTITNDVINITGDSLFGFIVKCSPNTQYTISSKRTGYNCDMRIREYSQKPSDWLTDFITQSVNVGSNKESVPFVTNSATKYLLVCFYGSNMARISDIMLNSGSTALPYEPYGYKIPISSNSTTTPVYLGEVESTRRIKKFVLTGEESWESASVNAVRLTVIDTRGFSQDIIAPVYCSHYVAKTYKDVYNGVEYGIAVRAGSVETTRGIAISKGDIATVADFKTYLQQQYANGTPVTVWYVLATPTTGIVNEPLMKIGDYADEVSNVSIPVAAGGDTLSVDTTVQPSEVTVNYKGWHPVADVHERDDGVWT